MCLERRRRACMREYDWHALPLRRLLSSIMYAICSPRSSKTAYCETLLVCDAEYPGMSLYELPHGGAHFFRWMDHGEL